MSLRRDRQNRESGLSKTVAFVVVGIIAMIGLVGSIYLLVERPDASATFTSLLVQVIGLVVLAASTFYGLGKVNDSIAIVQQQTNGNLSRRDDEIARLRAQLAANGIHPDPED